jgi:hypothetical protein
VEGQQVTSNMPDLITRVGEGTKFAATVRAIYNGEDWNTIVTFDDYNMNFAKEMSHVPGWPNPVVISQPWPISHVGASGQVAMFRGNELWEQLCRLMQYASGEVVLGRTKE